MTHYSDYMESPIGNILITAGEIGITSVLFREKPETSFNPSTLTNACKSELEEYFEGKRQVFTVPLEPTGTAFQLSVWEMLQTINFGETISYLELANRLGNPKVIRAAGSANGKNPVSIIIPCHRVIGKDNTLVGYGGGLWRKEWLLKHEIKHSENDHFFKM